MEGIQGIDDPFQTPNILECIFKNLDIQDLKECRKVCRTWRKESGKSMRALVKVEIYINGFLHRSPSKFLELVKNDQSNFFQAPFADTFSVECGVADCPEFWKTCGAHIKNLRLSNNVTFSSAGAFRLAIFQCCPNLEKLELIDVEVLGEPVPEPEEWILPQFTQNRNLKSLSFLGIRVQEFNVGPLEILSQFPCLEKLRAIEMQGGQFQNVFRALEVARQHDASCWKLKEVEFSGGYPFYTLSPSFARVFGEGDLTLTTLTISWIAGHTENVTTVQGILVAHAHSLKKLEIHQRQYYGQDDFPEIDIFPLPGNQVFENVETLKLKGVKIRSTRFLEAFPNVKKLMLDVEEVPEDNQTPHLTLDDCTQLSLSIAIWNRRIDQTEDFKRVLDLLPNLKKLNIQHLENEGFSLICAHCPGLTHLELGDFSARMVDDAGISGYDEKDVKKINKGGRRPITVRRANLSSLKNLRSFLWRLNSIANSRVGYCSEAWGILELPNLKHFQVERVEGTREVLFGSLLEQFPWDDSQRITFD